MEDQVKKAIEEIRPALNADGGDIELVGIKDGVVEVRLTGACHGCPHAQMTLTLGVEKHLKNKVPEIKQVVAI